MFAKHCRWEAFYFGRSSVKPLKHLISKTSTVFCCLFCFFIPRSKVHLFKCHPPSANDHLDLLLITRKSIFFIALQVFKTELVLFCFGLFCVKMAKIVIFLFLIWEPYNALNKMWDSKSFLINDVKRKWRVKVTFEWLICANIFKDGNLKKTKKENSYSPSSNEGTLRSV